MRYLYILRKEDCLLVVVDIQTKLWEVIFEKEKLLSNTQKLIKAFRILKIPIIFTEQYPLGMGKTKKEISELLSDLKPIEKLSFSCAGKDDFKNKVRSFNKKQIVVCGIEAHICVLQTVLDLLNQDYIVYVPYDAVSSRKEGDYENALRRMSKEGAIIGSVESAIFECLEVAGNEAFKEILKIVK
jgi:nicotinamidase-related amidase